MSSQSLRVLLVSTGLLCLGACSSGTPTSAHSPTASPSTLAEPATRATTAPSGKDQDHGEARKGGQVIESGAYHLEFVPEPETNATHLDFYLLKDETHDPIPNATVMAQVQLPDGNQKSLALKYDAADQHYTGILPGTLTGDYNVAILSDIGGKKINGRFRFKR